MDTPALEFEIGIALTTFRSNWLQGNEGSHTQFHMKITTILRKENQLMNSLSSKENLK